MNKVRIIIITTLLLLAQLAIGQDELKRDLIDLASIYHRYHASNPSEEASLELASIESEELMIAKEFIEELIKPKNDIASKRYLSKPDSITLKHLYIIRAVNYNNYEETPKNIDYLVDSLLIEEGNYHELISCYYGMLFNSITNKNRPLRMSKCDFNLDEYGLINKVEKSIFFLESMEVFGTLIWGYINIPSPPNFDEALKIINNYPRYNGRMYYEYLELDFEDFLIKIDKNRPKESFKKYHLNKYLNCVLSHSLCLIQKKKTRQEGIDVLFESILADERFWEFSNTPEVFESVFSQIRD